MKSKLFIFLLLGIFLLSFTSALLERSIITPELKDGITISESADKYPAIKIDGFWDSFLWINDPKADLVLTDHTKTCGTDCMSEFQIVTYEESALIDDIKFYTIEEDKRIEQSIRNYNFQYWGNINDYETQCIDEKYNELNKSYEKVCSQVLTGSHEGWIKYNLGDKLPSNTYNVQLLGEKKPSRSVDWIIETQGKVIDEWAIWGNISLGDEAEVILNSPADNSIQYTKSVTLNASANITNGAYLTNTTLYDNSTGSWGARNITNFSGNTTFNHSTLLNALAYTGTAKTGMAINVSSSNIGIVSFTKNSNSEATKGYIGTTIQGSQIGACDFSGNDCVFSSPLTLNANTDYFISTDKNGASYNAYYNATSQTFPTNDYFVWYGRFDQVGGLNAGIAQEVTTIKLNVSSQTSSTQTFTNTYPAGSNTLWNMQFCDSDGDCGFAPQNYTFSIDSVAPSIDLSSGYGMQNYGALGGNYEIGVTATDTNLDKVWYNYNGTNVSIAGAVTGVENLSNITLSSKKNITIYANDTAGNLNATTFSWDYKIFENSNNYSTIEPAGTIQSFSYNFSLYDALDVTEAVFMYNGTEYSPLVVATGQNRIISVPSFETYAPSTDTNYTFYVTLTLSDATEINTTATVQLVRAILLDNCSTHTNQLFNITLRDEVEKTLLSGDIELYYTLLNKPVYSTISTANLSLSGVSNAQVCSGLNLSAEDLAYSVEIRYVADGYAPELYHIQRADIGTEVQNIDLYDLNSSSSTEFKITYQDDSFNFVEGAVIQLQRKYISEGIYEVVEAPLTSNGGTSTLHIDLNSVKYRATVVKNGVVLDEFDNLVFQCQSELTGECEQKLLGAIDPQNDIDYDTNRDFTYSVSRSENDVTVSFSIPSGSASSINLQLIQKDQFGNSTMCNKTIISSAGSIECTFDDTIGESYIDLLIFKDGNPIAIKTYIIPESNSVDFLGNNYIVVVIIMLSLVGMALTSPEWMIINSILTMLLAGMLWLVNGINFVLGLGMLMWLVLAAGIIIFKLAKQEDR